MAQVSLDILANVEKAITDIQRFRQSTEKELDKLNKTTKLIAFAELGKIAIDVAGKIKDSLGSALKDVVSAATESEDAIQKLSVQMRLAGDYSKQAESQFKEFASTIQNQTGIDDDLILKNIALAKSYGFTNEESKKLTTAAVELSAVTGQDLTSSINELNASYFGNVKALQKTFPEIRSFTKEQLAAGAAVDFFNSRFSGTAGSLANTFSGQLKIASAAFSDLKETIGLLITQNPQVIGTLKQLAPLFVAIEKVIKDNSKTISEFVSGSIRFLIDGFQLVLESITPIISALGTAQKTFVAFGGGVTRLFTQIKGAVTGEDVSAQLKAIDEAGAQAFAEINKKTEDRIKLSDQLTNTVKEYTSNIKEAQSAELKLTNSAVKASVTRQEQLKERGYFINKKGEKCTGLGAAAENYKLDEAKQAEGRLKYSRTRALKTMRSEDFQSFCRILKRSYDVLQAPADLLQAPTDLFMLSFSGYKAIVTKSTTKDTLLKIIEQMRNAKADNNKLFANYKLDDSPQQLATIRAKISNTFRTIDTYIINNK